MRRRLVRDETGASATEYGLVVFAIAALIVLVLFALGGTVKQLFSNSCESVASRAAPGSAC